MKYMVDNDLHIHSRISLCSNREEQTPERILQYALDNGLKTICLTDHFWDEAVDGATNWYKRQNYAHITQALPLPKAEGVRFLFGCEIDMDKHLNIGLSKENFDKFDFVVIPTAHFHMKGFTLSEEQCASPATRAKAWVERLEALLAMNLPFHKVGIAHLTCGLIAPTREEYLETLSLIPEAEMVRLFTKAAKVGVGIEMNMDDVKQASGAEEIVLRPFKIAKQCGCKFYCASDAHSVADLNEAKCLLESGVEKIGLTEEDKFIL